MPATGGKAHNSTLRTTGVSPGGFTHPDRIVRNLHIPEGAQVADFGCGSGYFTLLIARMVGPSGTVTAIDVQPKALQVVSTKARDAGLNNIRPVRANLETQNGSQLDNASQDVVLLANILFQSQQKGTIVREAYRVLKQEGQLVMIDWLPHTPFGPGDTGWKLSKDEGHTLAEEEGFVFVREFVASVNHWGLLFKKTNA